MNEPDKYSVVDGFENETKIREGLIIATCPDAIISIDQSGKVVGFNPAAERIFGYLHHEALDCDVIDLIVPEPLRERYRAGLARYFDVCLSVREGGDTNCDTNCDTASDGPVTINNDWRVEVDGRRAGGQAFPMEVTVTAGYLESGPYFTGFIRDISQRKKALAHLARARHEADMAALSKAEFLANISHELRTPLNAIMGFSDFIRTEMFGSIAQPRYIKYGDLIHESGQLLLNMINDVLEFSNINAGQVKIEKAALNIKAQLETCWTIAGSTLVDKNISLHIALENNVENVWADGRALQQILVNLLSNSVKFSHENGHIRVVARRRDLGIELVIADEGVGIESQLMAKLMQPFERDQSSLVTSQSGTGLGLSIVKSLMDLHGGTIEVESVPGIGTQVCLFFPGSSVL